MNRKNLDFIKEMNLQSHAIVGNQNGAEEVWLNKHNNHTIETYCSDLKGLSNNRNLTLQHATADICLLSDDDLKYVDDYESIVRKAFENNKDADLIIFNLYEKPLNRYIIKNKFRVSWFNYMRFGSVRIAFKREAIMKNNIIFDSNFGAGAKIPIGEDTIFLHDCLSAGLNIIAVPEYILSLTNERPSTWFNGYDFDYFSSKGKLYFRISKYFCCILCLQDALRHRKEYAAFGNFKKVYMTMYTNRKYCE